MMITQEIFQVGGGALTSPEDDAIYLISFEGHAALAESEEFKVLFAQDVHGPLDRSLLSDREAYLASLRRMLSVEAHILCEGHYGVCRGRRNVKGFIQSFMVPD
jgi:hypothetical protein